MGIARVSECESRVEHGIVWFLCFPCFFRMRSDLCLPKYSRRGRGDEDHHSFLLKISFFFWGGRFFFRLGFAVAICFSSVMNEPGETASVRRRLYKDGFRDGGALISQSALQEGFDSGFQDGAGLGFRVGKLFGQTKVGRVMKNAMRCCMSNLAEL